MGSHIGFGGSSDSEPPSSGRRGSSRSSRCSRSSRSSHSSGVEVVEVVDVVEVVVLGSSSWQTLAFRASGSSGFHGHARRRPTQLGHGELVGVRFHDGKHGASRRKRERLHDGNGKHSTEDAGELNGDATRRHRERAVGNIRLRGRGHGDGDAQQQHGTTTETSGVEHDGIRARDCSNTHWAGTEHHRGREAHTPHQRIGAWIYSRNGHGGRPRRGRRRRDGWL